MRSFTIRTLMAFVVVAAVGIAGLRNATAIWAGCLLLVTVGLLLTSVLRAIYTAGSARAGWLGFSLFGSAYLALVLTPILASRPSLIFPTSQFLDYVHEQVAPPPQVMSGEIVIGMMMGGGSVTVDQGSAASGDGRLSGVVPSVLGSVSSNRWKNLLPGAANRAPFVYIGHCLFALLAGLLGALIARGFEHGRSTMGTVSAS